MELALVLLLLWKGLAGTKRTGEKNHEGNAVTCAAGAGAAVEVSAAAVDKVLGEKPAQPELPSRGKQLGRGRQEEETQSTEGGNEMLRRDETHLEMQGLKAQSGPWVGFAQPWLGPMDLSSTPQAAFLHGSFRGLSSSLTAHQAC